MVLIARTSSSNYCRQRSVSNGITLKLFARTRRLLCHESKMPRKIINNHLTINFDVSEWLNKTTVYNKHIIERALDCRPRNRPLITVSNHHSCFDDPGIWGRFPGHSFDHLNRTVLNIRHYSINPCYYRRSIVHLKQ